jgi:hypothetical protein
VKDSYSLLGHSFLTVLVFKLVHTTITQLESNSNINISQGFKLKEKQSQGFKLKEKQYP